MLGMALLLLPLVRRARCFARVAGEVFRLVPTGMTGDSQCSLPAMLALLLKACSLMAL